MSFRPRILVLPVAAAIIAGLVMFKLTRPPQPSSHVLQGQFRPAPSFAALDSNNKLMKLDRYLGRHSIVLIFFDGELGADRDSGLQKAREHFDIFTRQNVKVVAVSTALPQQNRQAMKRCGMFPFPLLSDPEMLIHQSWGCFDDAQQRTTTGIFVIDRAGQVEWSGQKPRPVASLDELLPLSKNPTPKPATAE